MNAATNKPGVEFDQDLARLDQIRHARYSDRTDCDFLLGFIDRLSGEYGRTLAERDRLDGLINNPHTDEFFEAVRYEMPHQRERWGSEHDGGKTPADWFWLIGYLAGKALHAIVTGNIEKTKHHVVTTAAALGNWFLRVSGGSTTMRPGIAPPPGEPQL